MAIYSYKHAVSLILLFASYSLCTMVNANDQLVKEKSDLHNQWVENEILKSIPDVENRANQGDVEAMLSLATTYSTDKQVDIKQSLYWFTKAAETGSVTAMTKLGLIYLSDNTSYNDSQKAFIWLSKAANQGEGEAQLKLADLYTKGVGTSKDMQLAEKWRKHATAMGFKSSESGFGLEVSARNLDYFKNSAAQGNRDAMHNLAMYYLGTEDTTISQAIYWLKKAAEAGSTESMSVLGGIYASEKFKNEKEAFAWFTKAANKGVGFSKLELARCYALGFGTPQNLEQATKWLTSATAQGTKVPGTMRYQSIEFFKQASLSASK